MKLIRLTSPLAMLFAVAALGTPVSAKPADAPNPLFTGSDLFDLSAASDAQISPDGKSVAYVRRSADIMTDKARSSIWLIDVAGGDQRPLAAGTGDHFNPRWSRDGRRLAYVSTAEGGSPQLYVRWMDTGGGRKRGFSDAGQRIRAALFGAQAARRSNGAGESARR